MIRTQSDSLRRVAETEAAMWQAEVIGPATQAGVRPVRSSVATSAIG